MSHINWKNTTVKSLLALTAAVAITVSGIPAPLTREAGSGKLAAAQSVGTAAVQAFSNTLHVSQPESILEVEAAPISADVVATGDLCDQYMTDANYQVLINTIGAIESGGQVYGNRNYSSYVGPYTGSSAEHTITLGWCSFYGSNAQELVQEIFCANPEAFLAIDTNAAVFTKAFTTDWVATHYAPTEEEKAILIQLITSDTGKACQDAKFLKLCKGYMNDGIKSYGLTDPQSLIMYSEIYLLGGRAATHRIFDRCVAAGSFDTMTVLQCLFMDFNGNMKSTMVGAPMYWQRHLVAGSFAMAYTTY